MSYILIAKILKFAGLFVGVVISLWGLTQKTTTQTEDGKKQVTPSGQIAIGLAVLAFLISTSSFFFENLISAQRAAEDARRAEVQALEEQATKAEELARYYKLLLQGQQQVEASQRAAEERGRLLEKQVEALTVSSRIANGQLKALALSTDISNRQVEESTKATERFADTVAGLTRAVQPLEDFEITTYWTFDAEPPPISLLNDSGSALWACSNDGVVRLKRQNYSDIVVNKLPWLLSLSSSIQTEIGIFNKNSTSRINFGNADILIFADIDTMENVYYDCSKKLVAFSFKVSSQDIRKNSGQILSVVDLEGSLLLVRGPRIGRRSPLLDQAVYPCAVSASFSLPGQRRLGATLSNDAARSGRGDAVLGCGLASRGSSDGTPRIFSGRVFSDTSINIYGN